MRAFEAALAALRGRPGFRVVQHSVQSNHAHFLVEADDADAPASSGRWFDDWTARPLPARDPPVVAQPRSWLLRVGWLRWGRIDLAETPGS